MTDDGRVSLLLVLVVSLVVVALVMTVVALVALAAGVVVQQLAYRLLRRRVAPDVVGHLDGPVPQAPASRRADPVGVAGGPDDGG